MVHNPNYDFDDRNIPIGAAYWVRLAEREEPYQPRRNARDTSLGMPQMAAPG